MKKKLSWFSCFDEVTIVYCGSSEPNKDEKVQFVKAALYLQVTPLEQAALIYKRVPCDHFKIERSPGNPDEQSSVRLRVTASKRFHDDGVTRKVYFLSNELRCPIDYYVDGSVVTVMPTDRVDTPDVTIDRTEIDSPNFSGSPAILSC